MAFMHKDLPEDKFLFVLNRGIDFAEKFLNATSKQLLSRLTAYFYKRPTIQHLNLLCCFGRDGVDVVQTVANAHGLFPAEIVMYARRLVR